MALFIDIRVNRRVVATARLRNIEPDDQDVCDYAGDATTEAFGGRSRISHNVKIHQHDRRLSVWALVAKVAGEIAGREKDEGKR